MHARGPWKAIAIIGNDIELIQDRTGRDLALMQDAGTNADAILMAAAPEMLAELKAARQIIRNALAIMTTEQKAAWGKANAGDQVDGEGVTRANERDAVIAKVTANAA